jgi:hypothetical protein
MTTTGPGQSVEVASAGGLVYVELLKEELQEERARKTSLEQRGLSVITSSGTLVTLLFALAAVVTGSKSFSGVDRAPKVLLVIALALFIIAALGGILTNWPLGYGEPNPSDLTRLIATEWSSSVQEATAATAEARADVIGVAKSRNDLKATALVAAMVAEVLAVFFVALSVTKILLASR